MADEFITAEHLLAPLLLRLTSRWQVHDTTAAPRAETVALYLLCGAGLIELRSRGRGWGEQIAIDFEATVTGVWLDSDRKSILPDELRKCVPAWSQQRVAVQLHPEIEVRLTSSGAENQRQLEGNEAAMLMFPAFVAANPIRGRATIRLLGNEGPAPGAHVKVDGLPHALDAKSSAVESPADITLVQPRDVEIGENESIPEKPYTHKPWPGSKDWHNWGVGVDEQGTWHLFHYQRSGDARAVFRWVRHNRARVPISAGQMDELARKFAKQGSVPATTSAMRQRLKPVISRLRSAIRDAVAKEGHKPTGNPIKSPTDDRPAWVAIVVFGTVVVRERHHEFVPYAP